MIASVENLLAPIKECECGGVGLIASVGVVAGAVVIVAGTALKLRRRSQHIVAVDSYGRILAVPDAMNDGSSRTGQKRFTGYQDEGIGYCFIPTVLDQDVVDI